MSATATPAPAVTRCPKCKRGTRVEHTYELGGVMHDASYCGYCGKSWPPPKATPTP